MVDGKKKTITIGLRVCPKSSPLFQCFKIWQSINNLQITGNVIPKQQLDLFGDTTEFDHGTRILTEEEKLDLYRELSIKESLSESEIIKLLFGRKKGLSLNFHKVEGNRTMATFIKACHTILVINGYNDYDFSKISYDKTIAIITQVFDTLGFKSGFLNFNPTLEGKGYERQDAYRLWHLLYSYSDDNSATGNERLVERISNFLNMDKESAAAFASITYESDYGSLSSKAMRRILPHMMDGLEYSVACEYAGYCHSRRSLTKEEIMSKPLVDTIPLLSRNSLRNPVVEKILNQMINVVNAVSESYGKPDEIRIEMARELKKSATEREQMTRDIARASAENDKYRKVLQEEFNIQNVSRNDIIRYRLYLELEANGFKTLYTHTYHARNCSAKSLTSSI